MPPAILHLLPINSTFERKTITVPYAPDVLRIGRQTNAKTGPTPLNGYFDSKVLSRQHAEIYADRSGRIFIRDVKSTNGTFVNGMRLSEKKKESEPRELREQDVLELGVDNVSEDQPPIVYPKLAAKVELIMADWRTLNDSKYYRWYKERITDEEEIHGCPHWVSDGSVGSVSNALSYQYYLHHTDRLQGKFTIVPGELKCLYPLRWRDRPSIGIFDVRLCNHTSTKTENLHKHFTDRHVSESCTIHPFRSRRQLSKQEWKNMNSKTPSDIHVT
jgi:hypothetical protein